MTSQALPPLPPSPTSIPTITQSTETTPRNTDIHSPDPRPASPEYYPAMESSGDTSMIMGILDETTDDSVAASSSAGVGNSSPDRTPQGRQSPVAAVDETAGGAVDVQRLREMCVAEMQANIDDKNKPIWAITSHLISTIDSLTVRVNQLEHELHTIRSALQQPRTPSPTKISREAMFLNGEIKEMEEAGEEPTPANNVGGSTTTPADLVGENLSALVELWGRGAGNVF